jgi:hypothetical protein
MSDLSKQMQDWDNMRKVDHARCGDISPCSRPICAAFFKKAVAEIEKLERAIETKNAEIAALNALAEVTKQLVASYCRKVATLGERR